MICDIEHVNVTYFLMPCIHMPQFEFLLTWSMVSWLSQAQFCPKTFNQGAISKQGPFAQIKIVPRHEWKSGETFMVQDKGIACLVRVCQCFLLCKKGQNPGYSTFAQRSIVRPLSMPMYSYELHQQTNYNVKALRSSNTPWKNWTSPDNHQWLDLTRSCPAYFPLF